MCNQILLLFTASWTNNRLLLELFLSFLPIGVYRMKLSNLEEELRSDFTNYFPDGVLFSAVLARDHSCIDKEVKFKMRTPFTILKRIIFEKVLKLIEQFSCLLQKNDASQAAESIVPIRYETLLNKLKQEEELELISVQELRGFLDAILHEDSFDEILHEGDVINNKEYRQEIENLIPIEELRSSREANLHEDVLDGELDENEDIINCKEKMQQREELMRISELQRFLDKELHEDALNEMLHEVGEVINYNERELINYERARDERNSTNNGASGLALNEYSDDSTGINSEIASGIFRRQI